VCVCVCGIEQQKGNDEVKAKRKAVKKEAKRKAKKEARKEAKKASRKVAREAQKDLDEKALNKLKRSQEEARKKMFDDSDADSITGSDVVNTGRGLVSLPDNLQSSYVWNSMGVGGEGFGKGC